MTKILPVSSGIQAISSTAERNSAGFFVSKMPCDEVSFKSANAPLWAYDTDTHAAVARMVDNAYKSGIKAALPPGVVDISNQFSIRSKPGDFGIKVFKYQGKIIVAVSGSETPRHAAGQLSLLSFLKTSVPESYRYVEEVLAQVQKAHPDAEVICAGHSAGAGATQRAAAIHKVKAVNFAPVGVRSEAFMRHSGINLAGEYPNIVNYVGKHDKVLGSFNLNSLGVTKVVDAGHFLDGKYFNAKNLSVPIAQAGEAAKVGFFALARDAFKNFRNYFKMAWELLKDEFANLKNSWKNGFGRAKKLVR